MKPKMNVLNVLLAGLVLIIPLTSHAIADAAETITKKDIIDDDYYAAGGEINIESGVNGDVVVVGGEISIAGRVVGDVMASGGEIRIRGEVSDDIRTSGGEVSIDARVGDDLFAAGGEVSLSSGSSIGGGAWLAGADIKMAGEVMQDLNITSYSTQLSGRVGGNTTIRGNEITLLESAVIEGDLHYKSPQKASIHPSARINGEIVFEQIEEESTHSSYSLFFSFTMVITAIVVLLLFPGFTLSSVRQMTQDPGPSLAIGLIVLVFTPLAAILLMTVVVGLWVGLGILALYLLTVISGYIIACFYVTEHTAKFLKLPLNTSARRILSGILGVILLGLIQLIPVIGGLLAFLLLVMGIGAGLLQILHSYRQSAVV